MEEYFLDNSYIEKREENDFTRKLLYIINTGRWRASLWTLFSDELSEKVVVRVKAKVKG